MKKARMIVNIAMTVVFLMILSVLASMVSGIMLSNKLYTFLPRISGTSIARSVESWLESISYVRNICAHYGRLYNAKLSKTPMLYKELEAANSLFFI